MKKREELSKRIADTKKKLQSVSYGFRKRNCSRGRCCYFQVGKGSPLKYSQSIHDLSHIPERDKCYAATRKQGNAHHVSGEGCGCLQTNDTTNTTATADLQLCNCYMTDFLKNTTKLSEYLKSASARKLQLDKTLNRYKIYKSLPVSPVSEERSFSDFVERYHGGGEDLKKICGEIEKFSASCSRKYEEEGEGSFSSDSLEENTNPPPRRCVSNNEIYRYDVTPKSESFYLKTSQESICNSLESVLSNDSECKSAPLEALFCTQTKTHYSQLTNNYYENCVTNYGGSLPKNYENFHFNNTQITHSQSLQTMPQPFKPTLKTSQTQTDFNFETPEEIVAKKTKASADFQQKLLKFESAIAQNVRKPQKSVAFFVNAQKENLMYIPSLESKNRQYKSKYCNVLNNKPEMNVEVHEKNKSFALTNQNFEKNTNCNQQTSSLDRHLFSNAEKVCHKPPKAVRRHSSKTRRPKYEYIKKEDFYKKLNVKNNTIELAYKEKNYEKDLEVGNDANILNELYDSLDKEMLTTKMDYDSLEVNLNSETNDVNMYDSLEVDSKNLWSTTKKFHQRDEDDIQLALENIKILNEIQRKITKINELVDVFKRNVYSGRVRTLSSMYEHLNAQESKPPLRRRRNLSLPCFVERHLNFGETPRRQG